MKKTKLKLDYTILIVTLGLLVCGLGMLYSASTVESYKNFGNTHYYFVHQLQGAALGLIALYICSRIDYHIWQKLLPVVVMSSLILLMLVKVPGLGFSSGGATRWIHLGPIFFQPAELAKIAVIFYTAGWISKKAPKGRDFYFGWLPALLIVALFAVLILWQPDLGTMLILLATAMVMFFAGGMVLKYFAGLGFVGSLALLLLIKLEPYRAQRLTTFLNPSTDPLGIGYQINQALIAIGSGGLFGYGYGLSRQKYNYLPEAISDSIFAVIAEELGLFRASFLLLLFLAFALRGIKIGLHAPDLFGKMVALGITSMVSIQAIINIAAISGLLPLTGVPLPFFSYGSSSLVVTLASIGILLNISRQTQIT